MKTATGYHIRYMIRRDMPEVLNIARLNNTGWDEDRFLIVLRERNCLGIIAEHGEAVVGYMIYELHKNKMALLAFAVHPDHQSANVDLMDRLKSKLLSHRRNRIVFDVPDDELTTHLFLRSQGFRATKTIGELYRFKFYIDS